MNIAIFISGRGSNMEAIAQQVQHGILQHCCTIALVFANQCDAKGLQIADQMGLKTACISSNGKKRAEHESEIIALLEPLHIDYIVLAGYMRLITPLLIARYPQRIINIHPANTQLHQGLHAYQWAFEQQLTHTQITVHFVDKGMDTGDIIAQTTVDLRGLKTLAEVEKRGLATEHVFYSQVLHQIATQQFMPKLYAQRAYKLLAQHADPINAEPMEKYMKHTAKFLGIKSEPRRALTKQFLAENGKPPLENLPEVVLELYQMPYRELHYVAIDLMALYAKQLKPEHLPLLEQLITNNSWWDSVDALAKTVGALLKKYPELRQDTTQRWLASNNMWLQRMTLIFQLGYKKDTDTDLLFYNILYLAESKEFFIQKAIGWILREYARTNPAAVKQFVTANTLKPLSVREALKHLR
jgi:formyltetrahydrofolate-dependent phosphoribosylglycinamide formyltransferase